MSETKTLVCLRCGASLSDMDDVTVRVSGVLGFSDGTLWLHGAMAKGWGGTSTRESTGEVLNARMYVDPFFSATKFCGPVVLAEDVLPGLDQDIVLGHVRAALFRALPGETAMAVVAYVEALVECALSLQRVLVRMEGIHSALETSVKNLLFTCRAISAAALVRLNGAGALIKTEQPTEEQ